MTSFAFAFIVVVIYIQCLSHIKSEWEEIWHESFDTCDKWIQVYGDVQCGYNSTHCQSGSCCKVSSDNDTGYSYIARKTTISPYSSLQIQFSVTVHDMGQPESCIVYYSYDDWHAYEEIARYSAPDRNAYSNFDEVIDLPSPPGNASVLYIWFEIDGDSANDYCYWDNAYLRGEYRSKSKPKGLPSAWYVVISVSAVSLMVIIMVCAWWFSNRGARKKYDDGAVVIMIYCDQCSKPAPCTCDTCNKCGKSSCKNECALPCQNCTKTECDGNDCRHTQTIETKLNSNAE